MRYRYTLYDRNNVPTVIDEPAGWESTEVELSRDLETHGMTFDYLGNEYTFYGKAAKLILAEYKAYGIRGDMTLKIEQKCGSYYSWIARTEQWTEVYLGKLLFAKWDGTCGNGCSVKIPIETTGDVMNFKNRFDQKVNLQTLVAFDGQTELEPYDALGQDIDLPGKGIYLQDIAEVGNPGTAMVSLNEVPDIEFDTAPSNWNVGWFQVVPQFDNIKLSEFGRFLPAAIPELNFICSGFYNDEKCPELYKVRQGDIATTTDRTLYFDWVPASAIQHNNLNNDNFENVPAFNIDYTYELSFSLTNARVLFLNAVLLIRRKNGSIEELRNVVKLQATGNNASPGGYLSGTFWAPGSTNSVSDSFSISDISLGEGDYLFLALCGLAQYINTDAQDGLEAMQITGTAGSVKMDSLSVSPTRPAKLFLVNEAISRVAEAITDDKIRAYSEYFGRTDSQPYSHDEDGCGSLEAITKGLFIRQKENRIPDKPFTCNISMSDLWRGLSPIHRIGMGIEDDPARPGYKRLRVEPFRYFYQDTVVMTCTGVNKINRKVVESEHYSGARFGYEKWEAEEYSGIDEFLTKREYRTSFNQIKNELTALSSMVGSGYALEITKRKYKDSKDWRYDNDTFIICLKRDDDENFVVELGNITSPENIVDPATIYNFRISPTRIAMRWLDKINAGYRPGQTPDPIYFTDGDGNYHAKGEMESTFCKQENTALEENADISPSIYDDTDDCLPVMLPERVEYEYPMTVPQFQHLKANPYGLIEFSGCDEGSGWIDTVKFKPEEGMASFTLIPKYE